MKKMTPILFSVFFLLSFILSLSAASAQPVPDEPVSSAPYMTHDLQHFGLLGHVESVQLYRFGEKSGYLEFDLSGRLVQYDTVQFDSAGQGKSQDNNLLGGFHRSPRIDSYGLRNMREGLSWNYTYTYNDSGLLDTSVCYTDGIQVTEKYYYDEKNLPLRVETRYEGELITTLEYYVTEIDMTGNWTARVVKTEGGDDYVESRKITYYQEN